MNNVIVRSARQYWKGLFVLGIASLTASFKDNTWLDLFILCSAVFIIGTKVFYMFTVPKGCKILHVDRFRHEVCMKQVYYKDKEQFLKDFETIIHYANKKGYKQIKTETHEIIVYRLLEKYGNSRYKIDRKMINNMQIGDTLNFSTSIGVFKVERIKDMVNTCARYEYRRIMTWKQFKRTFQKVKFYNVVIELNTPQATGANTK